MGTPGSFNNQLLVSPFADFFDPDAMRSQKMPETVRLRPGMTVLADKAYVN